MIKKNKNDVALCNKIEISLKFKNFHKFSKISFFAFFISFFTFFQEFDYNRLHEASPAQTG